MRKINHKKFDHKKFNKKLNERKIKASLTVEASILVPLALFTIVGGINIGYDLFQEAKLSVEIQEELTELDPIKIVRNNTLIDKISGK